MAQQSLIYSFVARGMVILADYTGFSGNFSTIASQCLEKLPADNNRFTYNCDGHTFIYLVDNGFTGRQIPNAFLERIKEDFSKRYGGGKAANAKAKSLNKEFGSKLKEHMKYCDEHPEEISKLAKVKAQVSEVKGVMMENIDKVLDRGEKIEVLVDKTESLRSQCSYPTPVSDSYLNMGVGMSYNTSFQGSSEYMTQIRKVNHTCAEHIDAFDLIFGFQAQDFKKQGTKLKRQMWYQNMKMKLIVFGIVFVIILLIILSICPGFKC